MKIFNTLSQHRRMGVIVTPAAYGDYLEVRIGELGVLALLSQASFDEMVRCGDAAIVPHMHWANEASFFGPVTGEDGGRQVFRCDVEVKDGDVWLVPEGTDADSKGILFFLQWTSFMDAHRTMTLGDGASALSCVENSMWRKYFCLIEMSPGAAIHFASMKEEEVPGTAPTWCHPRRQKQYRLKPVSRGSITLSADGNTIAF